MMKSKSMHTEEDVQHYKYVLDHLEERWRDEEDTFAGSLREYDAQLADSCSSLWTECYDTVAEMEEEALGMPPEMRDIHARLVDLQRRLQEMLERDHSSAEVDAVVAELNEIHVLQMEGDGVFVGDIEAPPPGWTVCSELLGLGYELASQAARTAHDEPRELVATADALRGMRNDLKKLMGQKYHTHEDVAHYRFLLGAIASAEGEYGTEWEGSSAEKLLNECADMVEQLEATADEMPPAVAAEYEELKTLKRALTVADSTSGRPNPGDLAAWKKALDAVDERRARAGGVFGDEGEGGLKAPPGQAVCSQLLHDCYTLLHGLEQR